MYKILFPVRLNSPGPIQTLHRQIARHLQEKFIFVGLEGEQMNEHDISKSETLLINSNWPWCRKGIQILRLYLSQYDIVHTGASGLKTHRFLVRLTNFRRVKHIHTHHTTTPKNYERQRWLANHADVVTAVSPFVADWVRKEFNISDIIIIPNGVDIKQFHPGVTQTEQDYVLFAGRLVKQKNPGMVLELAKRHSDKKFAICGDGPLRSQLERQAPTNVCFLGHLPTVELAKEYSRAAVILCPYEKEGFGMVVLEAMAAGTPVIATDSGNLMDLITEDSGELCDDNNIKEWNKTFSNVIESINEYKPRKRSKRFSWENITIKYECVYTSLISMGY